MPRKGFPLTSSLPSFQMHLRDDPSSRPSEHIPMRSIETDNLQNLPPASSPFSRRSPKPAKRPSTEVKNNAGKWTPISISSGSSDEDEKQDKVDQSLRGKTFMIC